VPGCGAFGRHAGRAAARAPDERNAGGISILRDYVRPKRTLRPSRVTARFETEPGRQLQTDWRVQRTVIAGQDVELHFALSTLGHSRGFHLWGTDSEDAEHTYGALVQAFERFGGVPGEYRLREKKKAGLLGRKLKPAGGREEVGAAA
jgi:transposase